ncbi:MAG: oligosaccharide flippase family protein [Bacteroidales bacterium]|nr:oligosaccharide flippase family protein [Bacteroidales bacterium]
MLNKSKSNFNQALWLSISYTCSMLVGIVSSMILSRYFDKVEYGTYRQIIFIYNTLLTIFQAGLPSVFTFFLPRYSKEEGKFIVKKLQKILFALGACFSLSLFLGADIIANMFKNPNLADGLRIFSIFPLFTLPTLGIEGIYIVNKKTQYIAVYQTVTRILMLICIVVPVIFIKNDYRYALIGWGIASFIAFIIAIIAKHNEYKNFDTVKIDNISSDIFKYSLPLMGSAIIMMLFNSCTQFFISRYYGTEAFAEFSNGYLTLPFVPMFISPVRSILTPIFSKASKEGNYDNALDTLYNGTKQIMTIMIPIIVFAFLFSKEIMVILYGKTYEMSSAYFRMMLCYNFLEMFAFSGVINAIGKTKLHLYINIICTALLFLTSYITVKISIGNPYIVASLYVIFISAINYFIPGIYLHKWSIDVVNKDIFSYMFKLLLHAIVSIVIAAIIVSYLSISSILAKITIALFTYMIIMLGSSGILKINYLNVLKRILKK